MRPESLTVLAVFVVGCSNAPPPPPAPIPAPATQAPPDVGPTTPETLAQGSADFDIVNLFVDSRFAYWAHRGEKGLVKVPLAGGPPITLVPGNEEPVTSLAADVAYLYFTTGRHVDIDPTGVPIARMGAQGGHFEGIVLRLKKDGSVKSEEIASGRFKPEDVTVDATHVYWINSKRDAVLVRQALGQVDAPAVVAHGNFVPGTLVVSSGFAYWIDPRGPSVMRVCTQGGEPQKMVVALPQPGPAPGPPPGPPPGGASADAARPVRLAATDDAVYFTDAGPTEGDGSVVRIAIAGGAVTVVAAHLPTPRGIAVREGWVYWLDKGTGAKNFQDGSLEKAPVAGGPKVTLATGLLAPDRLALSDIRVAWSELNGAIKDMAR
jgi:sugar lactone lactonase YvrE